MAVIRKKGHSSRTLLFHVSRSSPSWSGKKAPREKTATIMKAVSLQRSPQKKRSADPMGIGLRFSLEFIQAMREARLKKSARRVFRADMKLTASLLTGWTANRRAAASAP